MRRLGSAVVRLTAGPLLLVLLVIACGGLMSAISGTPPMRGRLIDIGGRRLRQVCAGPATSNQPTVLFESGAFGFAADWSVVQDKLARQGVRSCAYDRAGMGYSDPGPQPRDGDAVADDFQRLLKATGERGPFVLVGHSMAGLYLRLHAARLGDQVAGVVLVDATTPEAAQMQGLRTFVNHFTTLSNLAGWGASAGLFKPFTSAFGDKIGVTQEAGAEKRWAFAHGRHNRTAAQEVGQWMAASEQAMHAGRFDPHLPVAVVMAGAGRQGWKSVQAAPAQESRHGFVENVDAASHSTLLGQHYADAIVRGIDHVLQASAPGVNPSPAAH